MSRRIFVKMAGKEKTLILCIFRMLEIAIPELKLMLVWHEKGRVQCKKISDIDSSYEFKAKDHKFIERNSYHFIKPL